MAKFSGKDCFYSSHVELSGPVNFCSSFPVKLLVAAAASLLVVGITLPAASRAQEALVAVTETVDPSGVNATIAPEQSIDLSEDVNPPLPVAASDSTIESAPATTAIDSGIPRRFHYEFRLSVRAVYDDNINLGHDNRISDFYTSIEPSIMLGLGDTTTRAENYIELDYLPAAFIFADNSDNNSLQHVIRLDGQYRVNRLTLNLSQTVQIMDGVDVQTRDTSGSLTQQVNLDVAGRTRFDIFSTHANAAYYLTGKTFLSTGADFTSTRYSSLISSDVFSGNLFLNYNYSPKLVLGLGGTVGFDRVDEPTPDQQFEQINLRVSYQATGKIDFAATGGVEVRHFDGGFRDEYVSPVFEIGLNYAPFDGTKITLTANSRTLNSAVLVAQDYLVTNISVGVQQRLLQRIFLGINAGYERADYFSTVAAPGDGRIDDYVFVQPSVAVAVTRYWTVGAYYLHRSNSSSFDAFGFHDNQVGLRSTLEF